MQGLGHHRASIESFKEGLTIDQEDEVAISMAHSLIEIDRLVEADAELVEVLNKDPKNDRAHFARAVIAYDEGRWNDCIDHCRTAERSAISIDKRIVMLMAYAMYENGQKSRRLHRDPSNHADRRGRSSCGGAAHHHAHR